MLWRSWLKYATGTVAVIGVATSSLVLDRLRPQFAGNWPVTANVVAGALWTPAEFYLASVLVDRWLQTRERRRWHNVAIGLTTAIGNTWYAVRELLVYQYRIDDNVEVQADIDAATSAWKELRRQDVEQPESVAGTADASWSITKDHLSAIQEVANTWLLMWPAGLARDTKALHRRLVRVLLPRMDGNDPELVSAGRLLIDALEDLDDLSSELLDGREGPFPMSPFVESEEGNASSAPLIPHGAPDAALSNLVELRRLFMLAEQLVERGDRLTVLLQRR
jgi:hypothetical protein